MKILLTNDDGYQADGIQILEQVLSEAGHEVWVCAPSEERSAFSHAMTLKGKIKIHRYGKRHYHCSGTPADAILYGLAARVIPIIPDMVISGINRGYNASTDILYSGTVGAASEAALRGYPSIAVSARLHAHGDTSPYLRAAGFLADHLEQFRPLCTSQVLLNINVPPIDNGRWKVGGIGELKYLDVVERHAGDKNTSFDADQTHIGLAYQDEQTFSAEYSLKSDEPPVFDDTYSEADYTLLSSKYISVTAVKVHPVEDAATSMVLQEMLEKLEK